MSATVFWAATDILDYATYETSCLAKPKNDCFYTQHKTQYTEDFKCFNFGGSHMESFTPKDTAEYEALFHRLLDCWNKKTPDYQFRCASIFCNVLSKIYLDNYSQRLAHSKIEPSLQYIRQNMLHMNFSLEEAARRSYVSDVYFRKLFKEIHGISPKQYVIQNRIQHAASLILSGYCSLQEISEFCGYRDYKHFTTEFKRIMGVSPSQYEYNHNIPLQK